MKRLLVLLLCLVGFNFSTQAATTYADILVITNLTVRAYYSGSNIFTLTPFHITGNGSRSQYTAYGIGGTPNYGTQFFDTSGFLWDAPAKFSSDLTVLGSLVTTATILYQTNVINVTVTNAQTADFAKNCTGLGYTNIYRALLTQVGTAAPTAIVLENTFGASLVWARTGVGIYTVILANAFTTNKTFCTIGNGQYWFNGVQTISSSSIYVITRTATAPFDGGLGFTSGAGGQPPNPTPFEILVYP